MAERAQEISSQDSERNLVRRAGMRDPQAIRQIIKIHNQRLYRLARAIVRNNADAEDVVQNAYLRAFAAISDFRAESSLATWLSRITVNEALGRLRKRRREQRIVSAVESQATIIPFPNTTSEDPERTMAQRQLLELVEAVTDDMPEPFRVVFVARVIEGLDIEETAEILGIPAATVKTRLHRARKILRERLEAQVGPVLFDAFPFAGTRCDRLTDAVLARLNLQS